MAVVARPLSEITEQGIRVLVREMGAADAARFLNQFSTGYGDYTKERKALFEGLTLDEAIRRIREEQAGDS